MSFTSLLRRAPSGAPVTTALGRPAASRHTRRAAVLVISVGLLGLASCRKEEPITCQAGTPKTPADYERAFATRHGAWAGGDGAIDVPLPDGRILWLFGDTHVDGVNDAGEPIGGMIRNSLVVQQGGCFTMLAEGERGERQDTIPSSAPDHWFWPTGGAVDPGTGEVHVLGLRMTTAPGPVGWNWKSVGIDVATFRLGDLKWVRTAPAKLPADDKLFLGGAVVTMGPWVLAYGTYENSTKPIVAVNAIWNLTAVPWHFFNGNGWSPELSKAKALDIESPPVAQLGMIRYGTGFLASAKSWDMLSDDVTAWYGETPVGPFRKVGRVATTTTPTGWFAYGGTVRDLPGAGYTVVWSQNSDGSTRDTRPYGPRFVEPLSGVLPGPKQGPRSNSIELR